ncbi:unnamed protein product [Ceutorhynchus assimilis]|uniref:Uncharacterized protein n=1 Tax=Ceutorhynchus assimilis TaxID=467358 RepID=A0A9N9QTA9_9CUCU|nr:unnamed protein product [Ceutorhynchus assimilis]
MGKRFDGWTVLKIIEVFLVLACLVFKRVTDDEARSLFLYLQKFSREWGLLNNITWDRVGSAVADATYGGYLVITFALLMGKIFLEIPTRKRIMERILLGVGAVLFIALGSLAFASIDSVPPKLVDNAAILGTLSVLTGALFLLDMGGPKAKVVTPTAAKTQQKQQKSTPPVDVDVVDSSNRTRRSIPEQVYDIEREIEITERPARKLSHDIKNNGIRNGGNGQAKTEPAGLSTRSYIHLDPTTRGYRQMTNEDFDIPRRFGIYGKDVGRDDRGSDTDETATIPPKIELHTPVWSNIRKETAKKYVIPPIVPPQKQLILQEVEVSERPPSGPLDPGFVQFTAQHWGEESEKKGTKTPRHSPV